MMLGNNSRGNGSPCRHDGRGRSRYLRPRGPRGFRFGVFRGGQLPGGPKDTVQHSRTGYIARNPEEFIAFTELLLARPDLLRPMALAAHSYALSTSWERTCEAIYNTTVYNTYEECFYRPRSSLDLSIAKGPPSFLRENNSSGRLIMQVMGKGNRFRHNTTWGGYGY
jgi:hypothetical protein